MLLPRQMLLPWQRHLLLLLMMLFQLLILLLPLLEFLLVLLFVSLLPGPLRSRASWPLPVA